LNCILLTFDALGNEIVGLEVGFIEEEFLFMVELESGGGILL